MPVGATITGPDSTVHNFIALRGQLQSLLPGVVDVTRAGADGHAYLREPRRAEPFELLGMVDCDDQTALNAKHTALISLQGQLVSLALSHGNTKQNVVVLQVQILQRIKLIKAAGGTSALAAGSGRGFLLVVRFVCQVTTPPGE